MALGIKAVRALAAHNLCQPLVELQPYRAGNTFLAEVDRSLQHLTLGSEPEAVVDQLCVLRHQLILEVSRAAIQRDAFDTAMGHRVDRAARSFVHTAALHADEAVLNQIEPANTMLAAKIVQRGERAGRGRRRAVA